MKWVSIVNTSRKEIYELWKNEEKLLTLNYHPGSGTLRVTANNEKRVFLAGREGFLRSRTVLRNEYGIKMGQLNHESGQNMQGSIEVYDEQFSHSVQNGSPAKSVIYKNGEMLLTCERPAASNCDDLLMFTLCWYVATTIKKQVTEYA